MSIPSISVVPQNKRKWEGAIPSSNKKQKNEEPNYSHLLSNREEDKTPKETLGGRNFSKVAKEASITNQFQKVNLVPIPAIPINQPVPSFLPSINEMMSTFEAAKNGKHQPLYELLEKKGGDFAQELYRTGHRFFALLIFLSIYKIDRMQFEEAEKFSNEALSLLHENKQLLSSYPLFAKHLFRLGRVENLIEKHEKADHLFNYAIAFLGSDDKAILNLKRDIAEINLECERWEEADRYYTDILTHCHLSNTPVSAKVLAAAAAVKAKINDWEECDNLSERVFIVCSILNQRPPFPVFTTAANAKIHLNQKEKAISIAITLLHYHTNDPRVLAEAYATAASIFSKAQEWEQAKEFYLRSFQLFGQAIPPRFLPSLAGVYLELKEWQKAEEIYEMYFKDFLNEQKPLMLAGRALAKAHLGKKRDARELYNKCVSCTFLCDKTKERLEQIKQLLLKSVD